MRRVPGRKRLVTDTTTESARESWDERCGALTPISCGEKFESVILPTASARKKPESELTSAHASEIFRRLETDNVSTSPGFVVARTASGEG